MLTLVYSKDCSPAGIFKSLLSNRHFQKTALAAKWKINSGGDKVKMGRGHSVLLLCSPAEGVVTETRWHVIKRELRSGRFDNIWLDGREREESGTTPGRFVADSARWLMVREKGGEREAWRAERQAWQQVGGMWIINSVRDILNLSICESCQQ